MPLHCDILVATWNRSVLLSHLLESLLSLQIPDGWTWDVTVADNRSTDDTADRVRSWQPRFTGRLHYLHEPEQGKSFALNKALGQTQGDWVLFLDDDVRVEPMLLAAYAQAIQRYPQAVVLGGAIEPLIPQGQRLTSKQRWLLDHYPACYGRLQVTQDQAMNPPSISAWGANMMVLRSAMSAEGFATDKGMVGGKRIAGEDVELVERLLRRPGAQGWLIAQAKVHHHTPAKQVGWKRFWQWQRAIGAGWTASRGRPTPGKLGVPWWAWGQMARRGLRVARHFRPWPTPAFGQAMVQAAQWWGYLKNG